MLAGLIAPLSKWRWDWIGVGAGALAIWLAGTPASAYFLHFDAATQNFAALAWTRGCWEYATEKMLPVFLLAPFFLILPPSPYIEVALLTIVSTVTVLATYELAREFTQSRAAGLLAATLLLGLPAYAYFARTHLGYVLPFIVGGWLLLARKRWGGAGLCFSLAVLAHFGTFIPVAVSVGLALAFHSRDLGWQPMARLLAGALAPVLFTDLIYFLYLGEAFAWSRGTLAIGLRWSGVNGPIAMPSSLNWLWLPQTVVDSNGAVLAGLIWLGWLSGLFLRRHRVGGALAWASILSPLVFAVIALPRAGYVSRALAPMYPLWMVGTAVTLHALSSRLNAPPLKRAAHVGVGALIIAMVVQTTAFIGRFSQTLYPLVAMRVREAAEAGRPIQYFGSPWVPLFFGSFRGTELLINHDSWDNHRTGESVIMWAGRPTIAESSTAHTVEILEVDSSVDQDHPGLTLEAGIPRRLEIWWPLNSPNGLHPALPESSGQNVFTYSGHGCLTPPPFGNGTLWFYQLALQKARQALAIE